MLRWTALFAALFRLLFFSDLCCGEEWELSADDFSEAGITVDLRDPLYQDGVLSTESGGVVSASNLRIQAKRISYTNRRGEERTLFAEGELIIEYGSLLLIGDELSYNFDKQRGTLISGRSGIDPWYFGGRKIELLPEGGALIKRGYLTTSDSIDPGWSLSMRAAYLSPDHKIRAKNVQMRLMGLPLFWLPRFQANLDWLIDSPIKYKVRWGGKQGLRLGMSYQLFSWKQFKSFLRFEYRIRRGPGIGLETVYRDPESSKLFHTVSFIAKDSSIDNPRQKTRYRLEGIYKQSFDSERFLTEISYDKMSDRDILTHYHDRGLELETAGRTQLLIHRQYREDWVANLYTRLRVNEFQTLKQEIPSLSVRLRPRRLPGGVLSETYLECGYLNFAYEEDLEGVKDFHSSRLELQERLYRPLHFGAATLVPKLEATTIIYGDSPQKEPRCLSAGFFGAELQTSLFRTYPLCKHVIQPYLDYRFFPLPTSQPDEHYIFDIDDGLYRQNALKAGVRQLLFKKGGQEMITRRLALDLYAWSFFNSSCLESALPRLYASLEWLPTLSIKQVLETAWNREHQLFDYFNARTEFTASEHLAFTLEYRERSRFFWRKADRQRFFLETFHSEESLLESPLSDPRRTLLARAFARLRPNAALSFELRHGRDGKERKDFTEYEANLYTTLPSSWKVRLSYQKRDYNDYRLAVYLSLDSKKP